MCFGRSGFLAALIILIQCSQNALQWRRYLSRCCERSFGSLSLALTLRIEMFHFWHCQWCQDDVDRRRCGEPCTSSFLRRGIVTSRHRCGGRIGPSWRRGDDSWSASKMPFEPRNRSIARSLKELLQRSRPSRPNAFLLARVELVEIHLCAQVTPWKMTGAYATV